ncbi:hypothetical protein [Ornithinibacillus sp. FSL M8-0202]|uniref:hypothetical protein n=1 Tax=Ornithinibacillus sp. FSL M8-0202 TaxID=2921616 RepID=UPI0030D38BDF
MKKGNKLYLPIIGIGIVLIIMVSSVKVVFANEDIAYMLKNWFDDKQSASMEEIERTITQEKEKQTTRLKSEIHEAIQSAESQYEAFLEEEKTKRKQELIDYADQLISNYDVSMEADQVLLDKLNCLITKTEIEMDIVLGKKDTSQLIDCGELQVDDAN